VNKPVNKSVNELVDDTELAQYLERQSEYSARYRAIRRDTDADTVPPELDRLVLAQADGKAAARQIAPAPRWRRLDWRRMSAPLAIAAAAVFAVTVVMEMGDQGTVSQSASQIAVTDAVGAAPRAVEIDAAERGDISASAFEESIGESINQPLALETVRSEAESIATAPSIAGSAQPESKRKAGAQPALAPSRTQSQAPSQTSSQALSQSGRAPQPPPAPAAFAPQSPVKLEDQLADAQLKAVSTEQYRRQVSENRAMDSRTETSIQAVWLEPSKQPSSSRPAAAPKFDTRTPNDVAPPVSSMSPTMSASRSEAARSSEPELRARASVNREASAKQGEAKPLKKPAAPPLSKEVREGTAKFWLVYIRELRAAGKNVEADAEWKTYIKAYPKYPVGPDDPARPQR